MQPVVAVRVIDGAAVNRAVLTLIPHPTASEKRFRHRCPPFDGPTPVIVIGSVRLAGDFATDGPIETEDGWRAHRRLLRFDEERGPVAVVACGSGKWTSYAVR